MKSKAGYLHIALFAAGVVAVQLLTYISGREYFLTQITMSAYYSLLIIGLCLLMGYAGQLSLGHAGFFAMGGYISAALTTFNLLPFSHSALVRLLGSIGFLTRRQDLYGGEILNVHPAVACVVAVVFTGFIAYLIGIPVLKLKGHYLAMATLGFGIIIYRVVLGTPFFGEADGISDVPPFEIIPGLVVSGDVSMRVQNYYIAWGMVIAGMVLILNLIDSRVGRGLRAIHGAEDAANAMGINTSRYKLNTFVMSAVFAALAGVFLTHYNGGIGPSEASVMKSVRYVAIVAIGGMANIWGALTMGAVLNFLSLRGYFGSYDDAVFGGVLVFIMLFAPGGLWGAGFFARIKGMFSKGRELSEKA